MGWKEWLFGTKTKPVEPSRVTVFDSELGSFASMEELNAARVAAQESTARKAFALMRVDIALDEHDAAWIETLLVAFRSEPRHKFIYEFVKHWPASFAWPAADSALMAAARAERQARIDEIRGMDLPELLQTLQVTRLKELCSEFSITVPGKATKADRCAALAQVGAPLADRLRNEAAEQVPAPVVKRDSLASLVYDSFSRTFWRLQRFPQMIDAVTSSNWFTHIEVRIDRDAMAPCGLVAGQKIKLHEMYELSRRAYCSHPSCPCDFGPASDRPRRGG